MHIWTWNRMGSYGRIKRIEKGGGIMLKMPQEHTCDARANAIIAWYLNRNILGMVTDVIMEYENRQGVTVEDNDPCFWEEISEFFPENYPEEKMGKIFLGLKELLESEHEFVPELAMEYVMYQLIEARIHISDELEIDTLDPIPVERDYVIEVLKKEYPEASPGENEEEAFINWREKLEQLEDLHYYEDIYFWDLDYLQLDYLTESEIQNSPVSKFLGIDNIGEKSRKYVISPDWLK